MSTRNNRRKQSKNPRRKMSGLNLNERMRSLVHCEVPRAVKFFPDSLGTWGDVVNVQDHSATTGISLQYQCNNPFNLFGPRANYAGAFAANVPSGAVYLISSNNIAGAAAPYGYCLVDKVEVEATIQSSALTNTVGTMLSILFNSQLDSTGGMALTQIEEQPLSAHKQIPGQTGVPCRLRTQLNLWDAVGVSEATYKSSPQIYGCSVGVAPQTTVYCTVTTRALDGATVSSYSVNLRFRLHYIFSKRNNFSTAVPA